MSTYFYEMLLGKSTKKYTENPMTQKLLPEVRIDETHIIVKNVVEKLSELISQPYDYVKKYIIKNNENDENDFVVSKYDSDEFVNDSEEITVVTISYDTIYKAEQALEPSQDNIDTLVRTAASAYTFVVTTYNDAVT